jgi:hypothetical protein
MSMPLDHWRGAALPDLAKDDFRVGINWSGPRLTGWDGPAAESAHPEGGPLGYRRQNRWCVTPLGLGTTSQWYRSSSSSGDSHSRDPEPSLTGETATCSVSTR